MSTEAVPRFATARRESRSTRGARVEAASLLISRQQFLPWQRMVSDVANEYELVETETGLEIRLCYEIVVLIVPRQNGKTTLIEPTLVSGALRRPDVDVIYTAQDRQMSKRRLIDELADKRLARRPELAGQYKIRRSNGSEGIRWSNQSLISTVANTDAAGHGLTLDLVCLDEAFSHDDLTVVTALDATMITRPDPQLWVVSTVGDGTDGLLQHYQELGELSLSDPDTRIAYFEWSAEDDDDRDDPETWARCMPALGYTITPDRVRDRRRNLTADVFDRSYLCRRPTFGSSAKLSAAAWAGCASEIELAPEGPYLITFDVSADRQSVSVAVAGVFRGRTAVVTSILSGSSSSVAQQIVGIYQSLGIGCRIVADRRAGAGALIDALALLGLPVDELTATELVTSCGSFWDLVDGRELWHDSQPALDAAAISALSRPLGDAWAWDRRKSPTDISSLIAATNAVGLHRSAFGLGGGSSGIY